ncbi:MAG: hypothetical protein LQ343_003644 [Gyalolechia ehrenbergii]|nr:MAG: hypothetical protein LQ343_003644 [Gyalolechia ehrenbergii]
MPLRNTSSAKARNATSFVHSLPSEDPPCNVEVAPLKSVMVAYDKTPQAEFQVIFPRPDDERLGVVHTRREQLAPLSANLPSGNGQGENGFQLIVTLAERDPETDRVSAEKVIILESPSPVYEHAVHFFRESRTFEVWETPLRSSKKAPKIVFRRWAFLLDSLTIDRTKPFIEHLAREFRKMDVASLDYVDTARDFRHLAISQASAKHAITSFRALPPPRPEQPVVVRFDKTLKKGLCFTGFLASPEMQKRLRKLAGESSGDTATPEALGAQESPATGDEQAEEVSRS